MFFPVQFSNIWGWMSPGFLVVFDISIWIIDMRQSLKAFQPNPFSTFFWYHQAIREYFLLWRSHVRLGGDDRWPGVTLTAAARKRRACEWAVGLPLHNMGTLHIMGTIQYKVGQSTAHNRHTAQCQVGLPLHAMGTLHIARAQCKGWSHQEKLLFFWILSKWGGGPCPNFLSLFHKCIFGQ